MISFHPVRSLRQAVHHIGEAVNASAELSQAARKRHESYDLWTLSITANVMSKVVNNVMKYHRIDVDARNEYRTKHNKPKIGRTAATVLAFLAFFIPGLVIAFKKGHR